MTVHGFPTNFSRRWAGVLFLSIGLAACGGGSGSTDTVDTPSADADTETQLMVSLTDAEGDFLSYAVNLTAVTLTRANGATVEVLNEATTVDFAQYVDISELLAVRTVPVGHYESVSLQVDFSDAQIIVQSEDGDALQAEVLDATGAELETARIDIDFASEEGFVLSPRIVSHVTLDFDLDASNDIAFDGDQATVTVSPIWVADPVQEDPKPMRLRGVLADVDPVNSHFDINLRPFRKHASGFGEARIYVDAETDFEVDGDVIASDAGIEALAALDEAAPVVTLGRWNRETRQYTATEVYAGTSVPWAEADIMRGTVVARNGNEVSVRGALLELGDGRFVFNDTLTLLVGEASTVFKRGDNDASVEDISVGSAVRVVGTLVDDHTLDATAGFIRVRASSVSGSAISSDPLVLDLSFINGRRLELFDFSGTGTSADVDADPAHYELATAALDTASISEGDPMRALGFVREFGQAPADFVAEALIDASEVKATLTAYYGRDGKEDALDMDASGALLLDLTDARANLLRAGIPADLSEHAMLTVSPIAAGSGIFSVAIAQRVEVYTHYSEFSEALAAHLSSGAALIRFTAQGEYDSLAATLSSKRIQVHLGGHSTLD